MRKRGSPGWPVTLALCHCDMVCVSHMAGQQGDLDSIRSVLFSLIPSFLKLLNAKLFKVTENPGVLEAIRLRRANRGALCMVGNQF